MPSPDGARIMHAEMRIDGRIFFLNDDFPEYCQWQSANPHRPGAARL